MKKGLMLILTVLSVLMLTACGNQTAAVSPGETAAAAVSAETAAAGTEAPAEKVPGPQTLLARVEAAASDAKDLAYFTGDDLLDLLGIEPEEYTDLAFMQDTGMSGREIIALYASGEESAAHISQALNDYLDRRREETRNYAPEAYQVLSKAQVERKGLLFVLISGPAAEAETAALLAGE